MPIPRQRVNNEKAPRPVDRAAALRTEQRAIDAAKQSAAEQRARRAAATFHLRVGQVGQATERCEWTLPLFPLVLILEADGTLAADARKALGPDRPESRRQNAPG